MRPKTVDLHAIPDSQAAIHERLVNWARWCHNKEAKNCSPTFAQYTSTEVWDAPEASIPVKILEAEETEELVTLLPYNHKTALRWWYVKSSTHGRVGPAKVANILGLTLEGLAMTVIQARDMVQHG